MSDSAVTKFDLVHQINPVYSGCRPLTDYLLMFLLSLGTCPSLESWGWQRVDEVSTSGHSKFIMAAVLTLTACFNLYNKKQVSIAAVKD